MKKITWTNVLTVICAIGGALIGQWAVSGLFENDKPQDNTEILMKTASTINENLPMNVDSETILFATTGVNNTFTYNYRLISHQKDEIDVETFRNNMKPSIVNSVCTIESMQPFRDLEIIVAYSYFDSSQKQITEIKIDTKECPKT